MITYTQLNLLAQIPNTCTLLQELLDALTDQGRYKDVNFHIKPLISISPASSYSKIFFETRLIFQIAGQEVSHTTIEALVTDDSLVDIAFNLLKSATYFIDLAMTGDIVELTKEEYFKTALLGGANPKVIPPEDVEFLVKDGVTYGATFKFLIEDSDEVKTIYQISDNHKDKVDLLPKDITMIKEDSTSTLYISQ